ncbi:MAG: hypothetical protein LBT04_03385 [Prevotellaceae bacterium]|jgi:hypothetical protein|nr:hypothetical protein [Prevotellaceae bacterium]
MKTISDFSGFQCSVAQLDEIRGGRELEETIYSGCGPSYLYGTSDEWMYIYDDDTWEVEHVESWFCG